MYILILAGGRGVRLWPLSKPHSPKQFLCLGEKKSLLQKTIGRFLKCPFIEGILIGTNHLHSTLVKRQIHSLFFSKQIHILVEPCGRNTAPAIALAVKYLREKKIPDSSLLCVVPADHWMDPESQFLSSLETMQNDLTTQIALFGVHPTRAETEYGYIQVESICDGIPYRVKRFEEKPSLDRASLFSKSCDYFWNMGIFSFQLGAIWEKFRIYAPDIFKRMEGSFEEFLEHFQEMPSISFDYAILEKSQETVVYPLSIRWSDIGSWDSLYEQLGKDENSNVKRGEVFGIDVKNSLIFSDKLLICAIGIQDLVIVEQEGVLLISAKGRARDVREIEKAVEKFQIECAGKQTGSLRKKMESKNQ